MKGVNVGVISAEREIPNAKIKGTDARQKANDFLRKNNDFYEVLLVDKNNNITEGSKSNFFYIKDNIVYTAPVNLILPGITRKYIIKALENMNIKLKEQALCLENIRDIDSAFICGTSPGILPINMVNDNKLDVDNNILRKLMFEFNSIVKDYIVEIQCNIDFYTD
jgi:branched-chain amino acid aminotransferase